MSKKENQQIKDNIDFIKNIKVEVKVRVGKREILLEEANNIDIGTVIEFNQLCNDPLEILINDKVIALGEVVVIDGAFGVKISEIFTLNKD